MQLCHTRALPSVTNLGYEGTSVVMVSSSSRAGIFYQTVTCRKFLGRKKMYFLFFFGFNSSFRITVVCCNVRSSSFIKFLHCFSQVLLI